MLKTFAIEVGGELSITTGNGNKIVEFEVQRVSGAPALGAHVLKFSIGYSIPPKGEEDTLFHKTAAKVYVGTKGLLLGVAIPEQPITYKPGTNAKKSAVLYELMLSRDALDEVEQIRVGGDLAIRVEISGEWRDDHNLLCTSDTVSYTANQKEWIEALKQMRYRGGLVFELPMDIEPVREVKAALASIEKAKEHLYYGNYDDVVAKCRIALEEVVKNSGNILALRKTVSANRKSMSKEQRFVSAIDALIHFTNLAHHPSDEGEYVSYSRSEAIFVLGSTISAISSYAERIKK